MKVARPRCAGHTLGLMDAASASLPYWPTLTRLALSLGIGLFVGIERERRRKEAGLRTFAFSALIGGVGGLLDTHFAMLALGLVGILVTFLNIETIRTGEGAEITTSAALFVTTFAGVLAGQGHTFTPTALGVATAGLLAWKEPLAGFSRTLTESEFRSAVLLAILAFVIYPVLPVGTVDPWHLIDLRAAWITVILLAALGFANYILLKMYGTKGIELTGFLGGLVNSTVTVTELATLVARRDGRVSGVAFKGVALATAAMLLRNGFILALFAPLAFRAALVPIALMVAGALVSFALPWPGRSTPGETPPLDAPLVSLESPFSPVATFRFGVLFLALQVAGTLAERALGAQGFYAISVAGGIVSSASAVASGAGLSAAGSLSPHVAGVGALVASAASAIVDLPIVMRVGRDRVFTRRMALMLFSVLALGVLGLFAPPM